VHFDPSRFFKTRLRLIPYSLLVCLAILVPVLIVEAVQNVIIDKFGFTSIKPQFAGPGATRMEFVMAVVFSPLVETLILALTLILARNTSASKIRIAVVSALCWGILHGIAIPYDFIGATWAFLLFSVAYLTWCDVSIKVAIIAAWLPHLLANAITALFLRHASA